MAEYKRIMLNNNSIVETADREVESAVDRQVDRFSTDYTADKLNELYNEFDSITLDNSSIDTLTKRNAEAMVKVSARAKLYLVSGAVIAALLLFLMIYNFFVISRVNNSINILQDDITYQEYQLADKNRQLDNLTDDAVLKDYLTDLGYGEVSSENVVAMNSLSSGYAPIEGESNWFDAFCEFISSIFGG